MAYSDDLRKEIGRLHIDERKNSKEILDSLGENIAFRDELPSERTVQRIVKGISDRYSPEQQALDRPWQLHPDMGHGITPENVPTLLALLKWLSYASGESRYALWGAASPSEALTIRRARWFVTLYCALKDASQFILWDTIVLYGHRERWAAIENVPFETVDLDMQLAYAGWESDEAQLDYETAIEKGVIPVVTLEKIKRDENPLDPEGAKRQIARIRQDS